MVEYALHGTAVGEGAGTEVYRPAHLVVSLSPLALVGVEQQHQLLLNQLSLLGVGGLPSRWAGAAYPRLLGHGGQGGSGLWSQLARELAGRELGGSRGLQRSGLGLREGGGYTALLCVCVCVCIVIFYTHSLVQ